MLFTIGALLVSFSQNIGELLVGRFVIGFAVSVSAIAECIYISEISTPERRGRLVSLNEFGITIGILLAFLSNYCFAQAKYGWRIEFGISAFAAVVQAVGMLFLPRTPHFLMLKHKDAEAEATIKKLNLSENPRQMVANIRQSIASEESPASSVCFCFSSRNQAGTAASTNMGTRLAIGFGLVLFQQFTGQPNIIYYAADVFRLVGFCNELNSTLASIGLGVMKVISTVISLNLIDRIGRRVALIVGLSWMGISILLLSMVAFYDNFESDVSQEPCQYQPSMFRNETGNTTNLETRALLSGESMPTQTVSALCHDSGLSTGMKYLAFGSLVGFVCAFSFSFGPVTWLILSEIYPPSTKGRAMALSVAVNWLGNVAVSSTFMQATRKLKLHFF